MTCLNCPGPVPVISERLAKQIIPVIPRGDHSIVLQATFDWLRERHEGLTIYKGITGRDYTNSEKDEIGPEHGVVADLPCPYHTPIGCLIGGLGAHHNFAEEMNQPPYGWLPTMLARILDRAYLKQLAENREIADAKISLLTRNRDWNYRGQGIPLLKS